MKLCGSLEWRQVLRDGVLPYALNGAALGSEVLEIGPGPGMTTDLLRYETARVTAIELDPELAGTLVARFAETNVDVINADASALPFRNERFTAAVSFTMLHHVPLIALQDRLFAEAFRVVRPGGVFVASDSVASPELAALHQGDIYNPVEPATLPDRLAAAGFIDVAVRTNAFGWAAHARRPV
jgi:SAM-dependent methyltransferase